MPLIGIPDYLSSLLKIASIGSDEQLVENLHRTLGNSQVKPLCLQPLCRLELDLRDSNVYKNFTSETQDRIVKRLRSLAPHNLSGKATMMNLNNEQQLHSHNRLNQVQKGLDSTDAWISYRVGKQ